MVPKDLSILNCKNLCYLTEIKNLYGCDCARGLGDGDMVLDYEMGPKCSQIHPCERGTEGYWSHMEWEEAVGLERMRPVMWTQVKESWQPPSTKGVKKQLPDGT